MSIKPKKAVFQIRIDPDLLALFQEQCAARLHVTSQVVRQLISNQSELWFRQEVIREKERLGMAAKRPLSPPDGLVGVVPSLVAKTASEASDALQKARAKRERKRAKR